MLVADEGDAPPPGEMPPRIPSTALSSSLPPRGKPLTATWSMKESYRLVMASDVATPASADSGKVGLELATTSALLPVAGSVAVRPGPFSRPQLCCSSPGKKTSGLGRRVSQTSQAMRYAGSSLKKVHAAQFHPFRVVWSGSVRNGREGLCWRGVECAWVQRDYWRSSGGGLKSTYVKVYANASKRLSLSATR